MDKTTMWAVVYKEKPYILNDVKLFRTKKKARFNSLYEKVIRVSLTYENDRRNKN